MSTIERLDIADLVADAFGPRGATTEEILEIARARRAHPRVLAQLSELPERRFATMRDLWTYLPDVEVPDHEAPRTG